MIPEIVSALAQTGPALVSVRQQEEKRAKRLSEERQRNENAEAYRQCEERRWAEFISFAKRLDTLDKLRVLIAHLDCETTGRSAVIANRSLVDWLQWAKLRIDEFDPLLFDPERLFAEIVKKADDRTKSTSRNEN